MQIMLDKGIESWYNYTIGSSLFKLINQSVKEIPIGVPIEELRMPRCKLEKLVDNPSPPRKYTRKPEPTIDAAIEKVSLLEECNVTYSSSTGASLSPAIVTPSIPVTNQPVKGELKKLAGTPFLVDVSTGLIYLEPSILKAIKNS